jgi:probable rRNA maturation factor
VAVEVLNRQRKLAVDTTALRDVAAATLASVGRAGGEVTVTLSNDRRLQTLNRQYRGKNGATDVLSFPYDEEDGPIGDVIISVERARRQGEERGHGLQRELEILTLHGTLHVCGFDHETDDGTMDRLERKLRRTLLNAAAAPRAASREERR